MEPSPTNKGLGMPELHASILRFLGPLDWLKCAAVCRWWSVAILDRNDCTAVDAVAEGRTDRAETGHGVEGRAAAAANLWRDFAGTVMHAVDLSTASGDDSFTAGRDGVHGGGNAGSAGSGGGGRGETDQAREGDRAIEGQRSKTFLTRNFYRNVCLEGDPGILGPPLHAELCSSDPSRKAKVARVRLKDVETASRARSREPRYVMR